MFDGQGFTDNLKKISSICSTSMSILLLIGFWYVILNKINKSIGLGIDDYITGIILHLIVVIYLIFCFVIECNTLKQRLIMFISINLIIIGVYYSLPIQDDFSMFVLLGMWLSYGIFLQLGMR